MNAEGVMWMVGEAVGLLVVVIGAYVLLVQRISRLERASEDVSVVEMVQRISRLEAVLDTFGKEVARKMHRDDDKWEADRLLETYIERSYEMSSEEWKALEEVCEKVLSNPTHTPGEDFAFRFLKALAKHKLTIKQNPAQIKAIAKAKENAA